VFLVVIWALSDSSYPWFVFPLFGWGILVAAHAVYAFVVRDPEEIMVERAAPATQTEGTEAERR
jgi:hypothetical protein